MLTMGCSEPGPRTVATIHASRGQFTEIGTFGCLADRKRRGDVLLWGLGCREFLFGGEKGIG